MQSGTNPRFGGVWTDTKLNCLRKYLRAYTTALKNQNFRKAYIDAFAGSGSRSAEAPDEPVEPSETDTYSLFPEAISPSKIEVDPYREGSAKIALEADFDEYFFIEIEEKYAEGLRDLRSQHPDKKITVIVGDANEEVKRLCASDWYGQQRRAVIFIDPYGMQVRWDMLEAIAGTKAMDMWLLFPLGAVSRLLPRGQAPDESKAQLLDRFYGSQDWGRLYQRSEQPVLIGKRTVRRSNYYAILQYTGKRLSTIFAAVNPKLLILRNNQNSPMYALFFAVGNEAAVKPAFNIAGYILEHAEAEVFEWKQEIGR